MKDLREAAETLIAMWESPLPKISAIDEGFEALRTALATPTADSATGDAGEPLAWMNMEANVFARHKEGANNFGCTVPLYAATSSKGADALDARRWISVEEQLPERATPVLALVGAAGKKRPQRCAVLEYWTPGTDHSDDEPGWFEAGEPFSSDFVWPVTHWMQLPEKP